MQLKCYRLFMFVFYYQPGMSLWNNSVALKLDIEMKHSNGVSHIRMYVTTT